MALENFDELLMALDKTEGQGLPFSLLGADGGQPPVNTQGLVLETPPEKSPGVFDSFASTVGNANESINKVRDSGKKLGQDLADGIRDGIGSLFGQEAPTGVEKEARSQVRSEERTKAKPRAAQPQSPAPQLLAQPPLQGGSTQQAQPEAKQTGVNRIQDILNQQTQLRNQIRSRR